MTLLELSTRTDKHMTFSNTIHCLLHKYVQITALIFFAISKQKQKSPGLLSLSNLEKLL